MSDLILHHYDFSNYPEKVRVALGFKGLSWMSVIVPGPSKTCTRRFGRWISTSFGSADRSGYLLRHELDHPRDLTAVSRILRSILTKRLVSPTRSQLGLRRHSLERSCFWLGELTTT
ncbi:glutathione S-transferase N-terminal domain-containing protein [Tardiphaga sp. 1201_B9_N1_1]|uniref:glutathione S-transferase N-terminal domain-containing protein n=1 Tax=unclassified Tardiphaga TaxID=2631404 RepID=UPI003F24D395